MGSLRRLLGCFRAPAKTLEANWAEQLPQFKRLGAQIERTLSGPPEKCVVALASQGPDKIGKDTLLP